MRHLDAVARVESSATIERHAAIKWLISQCVTRKIRTAWVYAGRLRYLNIAFWADPGAEGLFASETVNARLPFGRRPSFRSLGEWTYIFVAIDDLDRCIDQAAFPKPATNAEEGGEISVPAVESHRGRRPEYDWEALKGETFRLMDHHDEFSVDDPEWNAQARLEDALLQFSETSWGRQPSVPSLRPKLKAWLAEWRGRKHSRSA
jgi:hypothetical protein